MKKWICVAAAMFLTAGSASAAEKDRADPKDRSGKSTGTSSTQEAEYTAAVQKCQGMEAKEKQRCIESAKERYGEMLR
jgi:hypothetical protein